MNRVTARIDRLSPALVLHVIIPRRFMVRVWLATRLIELATWVLGCGFAEEREDNDEHV